ncbi:MAG: hypothetical protein ABL918_10550, partial [Chakrabartia sp.]
MNDALPLLLCATPARSPRANQAASTCHVGFDLKGWRYASGAACAAVPLFETMHPPRRPAGKAMFSRLASQWKCCHCEVCEAKACFWQFCVKIFEIHHAPSMLFSLRILEIHQAPGMLFSKMVPGRGLEPPR